MASEDVQTNLRLPADLKDRLVESAADSNRSLSAEVALRLKQSFEGGSAEMAAAASEMYAELDALHQSEITHRILFRRAADMFGHLLDRFRQLGLELGPDVAKELSDLLSEFETELSRPEPVEILIKQAEELRSELIEIDRRLKELGADVAGDGGVSLQAFDERLALYRKLRAGASKPNR